MRKRQVVVVASAAGCLLIFLGLMSEWRMSRFHPPAGANLHRLGELDLYAIDEQSESPIGTVVLIHGIGGSIDDWGLLRAQLRERFRVVTVERPGNGWSSPFPAPPEDYVAANSEALRELLFELSVREPILVGWSYGGAVVLRMAAEDPNYPKGLVHLCGIAPGFRPSVGGISRPQRFEWLLDVPLVPRIIDRAILPNVIALLPRSLWMEVQYGPDWRHLSERALRRTLLGMQRSKLIVAREALRLEQDLESLHPVLSDLHVPTLIVAGELDPIIPSSVSAHLDAVLPDSRRLLVRGGRHAYHVLHPERVASLIFDFADELAR